MCMQQPCYSEEYREHEYQRMLDHFLKYVLPKMKFKCDMIDPAEMGDIEKITEETIQQQGG